MKKSIKYHFSLYNIVQKYTHHDKISANSLEEAFEKLSKSNEYSENCDVVMSVTLVKGGDESLEVIIYSINPIHNNDWLQVHEKTVLNRNIYARYITKENGIIQRGTVSRDFLLNECTHYMFEQPTIKPKV